MAKLKNIIKQLSLNDFEAIHENLIGTGAEKSAYLLKALRERQTSDIKIMNELEVNTNAYYTLRSRLNQRIEDYLIEQMESPRTDILKKVANINEILFTKKKAIAIATLKKLERELLDYDLSNELTVVYKSLKKLHLNHPDYFSYSQLYNKHVAFMLAVDKAEDILSDYFKKYGEYSLAPSETSKLGLELLLRELMNISALYQSHRLYVFQSCLNIFHRLFVQSEDAGDFSAEPIEDILEKVGKTFDSYPQDGIYYHLNLVFEFLKLEYYYHHKVYGKAESYYEEVNDAVSNLISNYSHYTFPSQFLFTKVKRHVRLNIEDQLYEENELLFEDYENDPLDAPRLIFYATYRAISCYYAGKYDEAARWINNLLNEMSLKKYPNAQLEIKTLLALQYCIMDEYELFHQLINSVSRQIRMIGKDNCKHVLLVVKMLKTAVSDVKKNKEDKVRSMIKKFSNLDAPLFAPIILIKMDDKFVDALCKPKF